MIGWLLAIVILVLIAAVAVSFWRLWVRPWSELEELVRKLIRAELPRTFILNGNRFAERIGVLLEDVFLNQQELTTRAQQGEVDINAILSAIREGLAVTDATGRVRVLNRAAHDLFAIPQDRIGSDIIETFRDPLITTVTNRTLHDGEVVTEWITVRGNSQRQDRRIAVTSLPMQTDGAVTGAVLLFQDVTELQHLEQVRREFVSNVSHELRTPLSIFRGYIETLLDEPDLAPPERERILRVMEKHSTRLHSLVDDLLSLARLEAPEAKLNIAPLSLPEFLSRIVRDWEKRAAAKELTISAKIADDLSIIHADEARFEEVLYNVLDNAVKYSRSGGEIIIRAAREGEEAVISVSDQGTGIAAADLPRIFERFYRADKARSREVGGTGLGLAIVKHIVQMHGGEVRANSKLGNGTTIVLRLPLAREFTQS